MDKILSTYNYGICLFSVDVLQEYLKREKIRKKKLLDLFQKDRERFLDSQKNGIWIPIPQIKSGEYVIKIEGYDEKFDDNWEEKLEYDGFNIEIKNGLWICDIGTLLTFNKKEYEDKSEISYLDGDGAVLYSDFKFQIPEGKYLVSVKGYVRKTLLKFPIPNYGYLFGFTKVDEFEGYKNPREEVYDFNIASRSNK